MAPKPPLPALIIGLGGSGALTVMHVKNQLLQTYNGTIPEQVGLVVFDTALKPTGQVSTAQVAEVSPREFGHLGGNAKSIAENTAAGNPDFAHIATWFQADTYLRTLPESLWQLQDGAAQARQMGRLALFKDLLASNLSQFYTRVNDRMNTHKRISGTSRSLVVFVIASIAGGTGAGLFLDVPHLVKQIAKSSSLDVQLRGFLFLPEAFGGAPDPTIRTESPPRAFAAMRELSRFQLIEDYQLGYPMYYQSPQFSASNDVWRGKLQSQLYDLVYLVDGKRPNLPLNAVPLEIGLAPSVGDAILSFIDSDAGEYQRQHIVNVADRIRQRKGTVGSKPYSGAIGTYSIILPVQRMVRGWAYQLGLEALELLLKPARKDQLTKLPLDLAADQNPEKSISPDEAIQKLLERRDAINHPDDPDRKVFPSQLWPQIYRWYDAGILKKGQSARQMAAYSADQWMNALKPSGMDSTTESKRIEQIITAIMSETVTSKVQLSRETKADPAQDSQRVINETLRHIENQVGRARSDGSREGGVFRQRLEDLAQFQLTRFRQGIEFYLLGQLNGEDPSKPIEGRTGKLGWTLALLEVLDNVLGGVLSLLNEARGLGIGGQQRSAVLDTQRQTETDLKATMSKRGGMFGSHPANDAQKTFRDASDQALDMLRGEVARDTLIDCIQEMRRYVQGGAEQLQQWTRVLATHHEGLYAEIYRGSEIVKTERGKEERVPSREVINNPGWEERTYRRYKDQANALANAMRGVRWKAQEVRDNTSNPALRLTLTVNDQLLRDDMAGEWKRKNAEMLMQFCRDIFKNAQEELTVLRYLAEEQYKDRPEQLGIYLSGKTGAMLDFDGALAGNVMPAIYLLAFQDPGYSGGLDFLNGVMAELRHQRGVANDNATGARLQNCDDPYRLTLVSMTELIPFDSISDYRMGRMPYMNKPSSERPLLHIFPAEVRVVSYEDRLTSSLKQERRQLSNRVAVLLEDIERFKDFLSLMAHRIIIEDRDSVDQKSTNFVYYLLTPSIDNPDEEGAVSEWWLTKPSLNPSLLEAMTTYIFREEDWGLRVHNSGYRFTIDYQHVTDYLVQVRQMDTDERLNAGAAQYIGVYSPQMKQWLSRFPEASAKYGQMARIIVEYDVMKEFEEYLLGELKKAEDVRQNVPVAQAGQGQQQDMRAVEAAQDIYDLYSVAVIVLREMMAAKQKEGENFR
jgi:hypothetical protein